MKNLYNITEDINMPIIKQMSSIITGVEKNIGCYCTWW